MTFWSDLNDVLIWYDIFNIEGNLHFIALFA